MTGVKNESVDIVISRAVLEHVKDPQAVFTEINRILKPGGSFIFIAPNLWDYVSLISLLVPNSMHGWIVSKTEGRKPENTFPTFYRANTFSAIKNLSKKARMSIETFEWVGQYPSIAKFNIMVLWIATVYELAVSKFHCLRYLRGWIFVHLKKQLVE